MAITKKFKVSFECTVKLTSEMEEAMKGSILKLAKAVAANDPEVSPAERELLIQALTHGPDGAVEFVVRKSLRDAIRETLGVDGPFKTSPATVRAVS